MGIFGKKWFRFIIFIVLLTATFVSCAVTLFSDAMAATNQIGGGLMFGMFTVAGQLFLFIAFDMLYGAESGFLRFLRMLFIILGVLVCLALGLASGFFYAGAEAGLSPWLRAFGGMWLAYGVISFYLYYFADYNFWADALLPFIQIIAFAGAYALSVIFAYAGDAAGAFLYEYPVMILCAVAFILMCIILKKKGLPFDIDLSMPGLAGGKKTPTAKPAQYGDGYEERGNRREDTGKKALKSAASRAVSRAVYAMLGEGTYGRIEECYGGGTNINSAVSMSGTVNVTGLLHYKVTTTSPTVTSNDIRDDFQSLIDDFNDYIEQFIDEEVEALSETYEGYDDGVKVNSDVKITVIK